MSIRINDFVVGLFLVAAAANATLASASPPPTDTALKCPAGQQKFYVSAITVTQGRGTGTADGFLCLKAGAERTEVGIKSIKDFFVKAGKLGKDTGMVLVSILPLTE